ncbi:MAG: RNA polymerase factor sigma-32 [Deltaproteobacteria bacterium]|nr:RNA polymerase factor sigma-32 [Candidatus Anaeroferrophillacea bacterium]
MAAGEMIPVTDSYALYISEINRFDLLAPEEERELARRYRQTGDMSVAHRLVTANLRFVVKVASEYAGYRMKKMDLIQEGNLGLMMAVKKFDPERGYRLISYAVWWIRAYIQDFIIRSWSLVKIGTTQLQKKLFFRMSRLRGADSDASVDREELTALLDGQEVDAKVEALCQRLRFRDLSLNRALGDGDTTFQDLLEDEVDNQETRLLEREEEEVRREKIGAALEKLTPRERQVVEGRFFAGESATLQEVGDHLGITRERVRQLEANAMRKLRELLADDFDGLELAA